jgi:hypothetical protein
MVEMVEQEDGQPFKVRLETLDCKRRKERKIYEMIDLVTRWNRLFADKKCTKDGAAEILGVSRKTIYDYSKLLRTGEARRFDFAAHYNSGIGKLRSFLRADQKLPSTLDDFPPQTIISSDDD